MADQTFRNGFALIVGVGRDLPTTITDAQAMHALLCDPSRAGYDPDNVCLLTEERATRTNILDALDVLCDKATGNPDATVIVYFSGHGGRHQSSEAKTVHFLVPFDFQTHNWEDTSILGSTFTQRTMAIQSRKMIVFLDCCHAGGIKSLPGAGSEWHKSSVPSELTSGLDQGSGTVVLASSHDTEYSFTGTPYSVFTAALLEGMMGANAIPGDSFARVLGIVQHVLHVVPSRTNAQQHPYIIRVNDVTEDFPVCFHSGGAKSARLSSAARSQVSLAAGLERQQAILIEKIARLRVAHVHGSVEEKFRLEHLIEQAENEYNESVKRQRDLDG